MRAQRALEKHAVTLVTVTVKAFGGWVETPEFRSRCILNEAKREGCEFVRDSKNSPSWWEQLSAVYRFSAF